MRTRLSIDKEKLKREHLRETLDTTKDWKIENGYFYAPILIPMFFAFSSR